MELRRFMNSIKRMFWLVILLSVIGGGFTTYTSYYRYTPMYIAETTVYAMSKGSSSGGNGGINYQDVMLSRQLVQDYHEIVSSEKVLALAAKQLEKYQISLEELKSMISVTPKNESSVIGISAVAYEPRMASDASTAVTEAFITRLRELTDGSIVGVLSEAKEPQFPVPNNNLKNIIISSIMGIIAALVVIYIRELYDTKIRYTEDVEYSINLKVIGIIPEYGIK